MKHINWFPGHMAKTIKTLKQQLSQTDIIVELLDARIPFSSRNPIIDTLIQEKHFHIIALTKTDLADETITKEWLTHLKKSHKTVVAINSLKGKGVKQLLSICKQFSDTKKAQKRFYITKVMICGIPNVGKSELINKLAKKKANQVQNKPGVTKKTKGFLLDLHMELIDTPGILWPKLDNQATAKKLALTKSIKETITEDSQLADWLLSFLKDYYPDRLKTRYKLNDINKHNDILIEDISYSMKWLTKNNTPNEEKATRQLIEDFQKQRFGAISFDQPTTGVG
tara:strand:+ start:3262 stop:4110 length:849 start_codon:yes stop_codon:yes gene_type:complete